MKYLLEGYLTIAIIAYFILGSAYNGDPDRWEKAFWGATVWPIIAIQKMENND